MKYFVTGGSGFIGQHLIRRLVEGRENVVYCLLRDENKLPQDIRSSIKICKGDDTSLAKYAREILSSDVIFHAGGRADLGDGDAYQRDNVDFTTALIKISERSKKLKRFIFTSTIGAVDRSKDDQCIAPLTEESTPSPLTEYGRSKLSCEIALKASALPFVIVRPVLVYGPGMRKKSHLRVFLDAVEKQKLFARCNFPGKMSFIHVNDLIAALILVSTHPKAVRQTFFAADDEPISLGSLFNQLGNILGKRAGSINVSFAVFHILRRFRPFLPLRAQNLYSDVLTASNKKLRSLGFVPKAIQADAFRGTAHDHFKRENPNRGMAVITGGAGGIGGALSAQLFARGYSVTIVDRNKALGRSVAKSLDAELLHADLSTEKDVDNVVELLHAHSSKIDLLVNNAGIGKRGNTEEIPVGELIDLLRINCEVPVRLTNAILPEFIKRGRGTIINIGSSSGFQPLPYMSTYAASKSFIMHYTVALQGELAGRGIPGSVEIILASPSGTATNFQRNAGVKEDDHSRLLSPDHVASVIVGTIGKGSSAYIIGFSGKMMNIAGRILPLRVQSILWEKLMRSMR